MEISQNIEMIGLSLWLKEEKTLLISDIHLGYEEELQQKGIFVPKFQIQEIIKNLEEIFQKIKPNNINKIIINGDLKHEFGRILKQEWKDVLQLMDFLLLHCQELILIKGNHDSILGPIASKRKVQIIEFYILGENLIIHGDKKLEKIALNKLNFKKINRFIIGHEHPAISLKEKSKVEKYKCFLKGRWKEPGQSQKKELIVLPSFNPLLEGTDIIKENLLSPFLSDINDFEVYVAGEKDTFYFGKVKDLNCRNIKL